jgi:hypothetical protein
MCCILVVLFNANVATAQSSESTTSNDAAINGAWQRNSKTTSTGEPKEFGVMNDGFFPA